MRENRGRIILMTVKYAITAGVIIAVMMLMAFHMKAFYAVETMELVEMPFDETKWEWDLDTQKYRLTIRSECRDIDYIEISPDVPLDAQDISLQRVLYNGTREDTNIKEIVEKEDNSLVLILEQELYKNVDGAASYDLCIRKETGCGQFTASARIYTDDRAGYVLLYLLLLSVPVYAVVSRKMCWNKKAVYPVYPLYILAGTALMFYTFEVLGNEKMKDMGAAAIGKNLLIYGILILIAACLLNSVRNGILAMQAAGLVCAVVNHYVLQFRSQPIQPADIFNMKTAAAVSGQYTYGISVELLYVIAIHAAWILFMIWQNRMTLWRVKRGWLFSAGTGVLSAVALYLGLYYAPLGDWLLPAPSYWNSRETYGENGFGISFLAYGNSLIERKAPGYTAQGVEAVREKYGTDLSGTESDNPPNIIVIMNEAMADYRNIGDFSCSENYFTFWDSIKENAIKGKMQVPAFAGGTANTEYEFLTGNSLSYFDGNGVPYTMLRDRLHTSIALTLKEQGYDTIAMHPNAKENYNRNLIYPNFGFDEFYSIEDLFQDAPRLRGMVSDYGDYSKMLEWIRERGSEDPYFIFNITMQNHSGYQSNILPVSIYAEDYDYPDVNEYLTLLGETDKALEYLIGELEKTDEKTVLVIFGDHYPAITQDFAQQLYGNTKEERTREQIWDSYEVPLLIWANYEIEEQDDFLISANYLGSYLLDLLGLRKSGYQQFLLDLYQEIPVLATDSYMDKNGKIRPLGNKEGLPDLLEQYYWLQYEQLYKDSSEVFWAESGE